MPSIRPAATVCALVLAVSCGGDPAGPGQNTAPTVAIVSPVTGSTFAGGTSVAVALTGNDAEDGAIGNAGLSWWVALHHGTHTHPFVPVTAGSGGSAEVPRVGHVETNIFLRVYGRAVDSGGLADTAFVDVDPRLITLRLRTSPAGLELVLDGQPRTTPVDVESVVGIEHTLWARSPQSMGAFAWAFDSWTHGGAAEQAYVAPDTDVTLTATYTESGPANVPPTVTLTSPEDGATVTSGVAITLAAEASDGDGTITNVQFVEEANVIGNDTSPPYTVVWTPSGLGTRVLRARATDDFGETTTSDAVTVTVQAAGGGDVLAPVATLTSPAHGTSHNGSVTATATATDDVGVVEVEFQVDGETIGTDTSAPYSATLPATSGYTTGAHTFRVRARDAAGNWSPWSSANVLFGGNVDLPNGFTRSTWVTGFNGGPIEPLTAATFAPDGRLFVLEIAGGIRIVKDGALLPTPFATVSALTGGERGLLGIALDPSFATNGYVYVYYTTTEGGTHNRISRFTANGDVAVPGSEVVLVDLEPLNPGASNHNGGAMAFGPDGKLYVAVGDNASPNLSQSLSSRFGKILRYNPDGSIPGDNPLVGSTSGEFRAIWATGLRNPYTFAFQPGTGRMHINDVGQDLWEEINQGLPGANYGWPATEGPTDNPAYVSPILAYHHFNSPETLYTGFAVVGAAFYNPTVNTFGAAYTGDFFFADYVEGWVYRMDSDEWSTAYAFARVGEAVFNVLVGPDGALYLVLGNRIDRITR